LENLRASDPANGEVLLELARHYDGIAKEETDEDKRAAGTAELVVGPYQGTLGCLRIPFGRGVCGAAAATGETQLIDDVHAFPGHIACDSRSAIEIVVPVRDAKGRLIAVLDVDSTEKAAFDGVDQAALEDLLSRAFAV
jgi:GAF domain-containing protein